MQSWVLNKQRMRENAVLDRGTSRYVAGPFPARPRLLKAAPFSFPSFRDAYRTRARRRHTECNPIPP